MRRTAPVNRFTAPRAGAFFRLSTWGLWPVFRGGFGFTAHGWEHIPATGSALLIANHQSYFDPLLLALLTPRTVGFAAKEELFRGLGGWVFPRLNSFPVKRGTPDIAVFRQAQAVLDNGKLFCLFAEGTRTPDGEIHPLQPGAVAMALRADVPIIPIGIAGCYEAMPRQGGLKRHMIGVEAGPPMRFLTPTVRGPQGKRMVERVGVRVHEELVRLKRRIEARQAEASW